MRTAILAVAILSALPARAGDLPGKWVLDADGVRLTLVLEAATGRVIRGTLASSKGTTLVLEGSLEEEGIAVGTCGGAGGQSMFEAELDEGKLVLTLVEVGPGGAGSSRSLEFVRASGGAAARPPAGAAPGAAPPRPADPLSGAARPPPPGASHADRPEEPAAAAPDGDLRRYFAGQYYSYTSGSTITGGAGTERTLSLCADGTYRDSYEGTASGGGWGSAAQSAGGGRWSIQGDRLQGVIVLTGADGGTRSVPYRVLDKGEGTIRFGGTTFAFAGEPRCR